jgi:TetR/AcrR family fatty acid metabolism transcriptional regulator
LTKRFLIDSLIKSQKILELDQKNSLTKDLPISDRQFELIEAAGTILSKSGVSGLTIKNLAAEMKFSESAVYRHFASKEDIIMALLTYLTGNMDQRLAKVVAENLAPEAKLKSLFESQFQFFSENPHFVVAVFCDGLMEESSRINEAISKIIQVKMKYLQSVISEGQQKGEFTNALNTSELIHIVLGSFRLLMYKWRIANFEFNLKEQGNTLVDSLLKLIKTN